MDDENDRTRGQRYEDTKRELLAVLGAGSMDESTRKRQFVKLFDHFRSDYTQLSVKLRENIRLQRRLLGKCLQTKNELVACAQKAKDAQQVQADEMKNLVFYRDECEHAWKQNALSQERERDAMNMIDELKTKMEDLQSQLQAVMVNGLPSPSARRHPHDGSCPDLSRSTPLSTSSKLQPPRLASPASSVSPVKRIKYQTNESSTMPPMLSFEEWKLATKVWCPATPLSRGSSSRAASTPSKAAAHTLEHQHATNRCVSVPSLHMTPMERVNLSQQQQRVKPAAIIRAETAPAQVSALIRQGGTPAIKRRVPRQLPHVY